MARQLNYLDILLGIYYGGRLTRNIARGTVTLYNPARDWKPRRVSVPVYDSMRRHRLVRVLRRRGTEIDLVYTKKALALIEGRIRFDLYTYVCEQATQPVSLGSIARGLGLSEITTARLVRPMVRRRELRPVGRNAFTFLFREN